MEAFSIRIYGLSFYMVLFFFICPIHFTDYPMIESDAL